MIARIIIKKILGLLCVCLVASSLYSILPSSANATADVYEPDNTPATASTISTDGTLQSHTIDPAGDIDYISFWATSEIPLLIETSNLADGCNTYIYLYDIDGTTLIEEDDDGGDELLASKIEWTPEESGIYFIRVVHFDNSGTGFYDVSISTFTPDVYEPDNTPAMASTISTDGTLQSHTIDPAGDIDYISFSATSGIPLLIETSNLADGCNTYIYLYGIDGTTLIEEDDDGGDEFLASKIEWTPEESGIYFIRVVHFDNSGTGFYDVSISTFTPDVYEPDNTPATASTISTDGTVQRHTINPAGDMDYISFVAISGAPLIIETFNLAGGCDTRIYLYDTDGTTLIEEDDESGDEFLASKIEWTPEESGIYFIKVVHFDSSGTGFYDISVSTHIPDGYEPDDTTATATAISTNGTLQSHTIDPAGDIDYISFSATAGAPCLIKTSNLANGCDTYIYLYDTDGTTLIAEDDDGGEDLDSRIEWTPASSGTYYIRVHHYNSSSGTGAYDVSVSDMPDAYEPDNTSATASTISTDGTSQRHTINPAGDIDYISFVATSGSPLLIETSNLANGCDTYIYLYDIDGTTLIAEDDDSGEGLASRIQWTPTTTGTYYFKVIHVDGSGTGFYDVSIRYIPAGQPIVNFEGMPTSGDESLTVDFTDLSISFDGLALWMWDFGDGQISSEQNPTHEYTQDGIYTVTLAVVDSDGDVEIEEKTDYIEVSDTGPTANFNCTPGIGDEPLTVSFADQSNANDGIISWLWDFGDGQTSTEQNPTHIYTQDGIYTVTLTVVDSDGDVNIEEKTDYIEVSDTGPTANFNCTPGIGDEPLTASFTDTSTSYDPITSWLWDFGDGHTSTEQDPTHIYIQDGIHTVTLTVTDADGSNGMEIKIDCITISDTSPTADFERTPIYKDEVLTVYFTDLSTSYESITSWLWDFGDGHTSTEQDPTHEYTQHGTFTVSLTVTDADGSNGTKIKMDCITISDTSPTADFESAPTPFSGDELLTFDFADLSKPYDSITSWLWDFGDGQTSTEQNPTHEYTRHGIFNISLTVIDNNGIITTETKTDYIVAGIILAQQTISPDNPAIVQSEDGQIVIEFPEDSVDNDTEVIVWKASHASLAACPSGFKVGETCFTIDLAADLVEGTMITITINHNADQLKACDGDPNKLTLSRYDENTGEWFNFPTMVNTHAMSLSTEIDQYSTWLIMVNETHGESATSLWIWLVTISGGLGVPLAIGSAIIIKRWISAKV